MSYIYIYRQGIYVVIYIYKGFIFDFCKLSNKQSMLEEREIDVCSMAFQDNYCQTGYSRYIPGIYHVYSMHIPC